MGVTDEKEYKHALREQNAMTCSKKAIVLELEAQQSSVILANASVGKTQSVSIIECW